MKSMAYDPHQKIPVSDAVVTLSAQMIEGGSYHVNFKKIETTTTGNDGKFSINTAYGLVTAYRIEIAKEQYYQQIFDIDPTNVKVNVPYADIYMMHPVGWLQVQIVDTSGLDSIRIRTTASNPSCSQCCFTGYRTYYGTGLDTTITCQTVGAQQFNIIGETRKLNESLKFTLPVFCTAFDTTTVLFEY